ncbi:hypothetical protein AAFL31_25630 [Klebsiella huaxiensis]|uniref:hypothetical protein n=1 Tax=Klebsiella huaxiensis TaxID=2153354 RepID=UPI0031695D76
MIHDDLRFQYSVLIESIFSLIDYIEDKKVVFNNDKFQIERKIKKEIGSEGNIIVDYMRELRNSIIHRGADATSAGNVVKDRVAVLAPDNVTSRNGTLIQKPKEIFLDKLLAVLDNATKNVIISELNGQNILEENNTQSISDLVIKLKNMPLPHNAPNIIKMMIVEQRKKTSEEDFLSLATEIYNSSLVNLMKNLEVRMNVQHLS